jgi:phosphatidylglycerol:prolipoprotein diacylglycerol transferase
MHPILIDFGFFQLPSYGVLLATAVIVALWTARLRANRVGMDGTQIVDFGLWLVIWALIGAKLLLVLVELPRYLKDPASILGTIRAGGVFLGGFVAAVIAAIVLLRRYGLPALQSFDVL